MSQPDTDQEYQDLDPWNGLFYSMAERLTPLFAGEGRGMTYARYAAGEAIAGYHPETRADYASIARILALSLATVTASVRASDPAMPIADQLRFLGKAQGLSQGADRAERLMTVRRNRTQEEEIRGDTLVPRPAHRPSRYALLPPDDPASGRATAPKADPQPTPKAPEPDPVPAQAVPRANPPEVATEQAPHSAESPMPSACDPAPQRPSMPMPMPMPAITVSPIAGQMPIAATSTAGKAATLPLVVAPAAPVEDPRHRSFGDGPLNGRAEPSAYPSHPGPPVA